MRRSLRSKNFFALLSLTFVSLGCSGAVDSSNLSGKVTYRAQPLADGSMTFYPLKGRPTSVGIDSIGQYEIDLPPGDYRVAIQAPGSVIPPGWKEGDPPPPPPSLILPPEYSQRSKTTLSVAIAEGGGSQNKDFELK
jgi:hypothetical protein